MSASKDSSVSAKNKAVKRPSGISGNGTKLDIHRTKGSILNELNMTKQERLELRLKADLHQDILRLIKKKRYTPRQIEKLFDIPQPRVSELLRGKLSLLSISKLLYYAHLLGAHANVRLRKARPAA